VARDETDEGCEEKDGANPEAVYELTKKRGVVMTILVNEQIQSSEFRPSDKCALLDHLNDREIYDLILRIPFPYTDADNKIPRQVHDAVKEAPGGVFV